MWVFLVSLHFIIAMPLGANAFSTDTELCFTGSGSHRIDIDVCSRALCEEIPSPLTRSTLLIRRGEAFLSGKIYELTLQDFSDALSHNSALSEAHKMRGYTFTKIGCYRVLLESYEKSLKLNEYAAGTHKGRGLALILSDEFESAIKNLIIPLPCAQSQISQWANTRRQRSGCKTRLIAHIRFISVISKLTWQPASWQFSGHRHTSGSKLDRSGNLAGSITSRRIRSTKGNSDAGSRY